MGLMDDAMQSDSGFSADTDEFAEAVTYTRQDGGGTATVNAIVNRINAESDIGVRDHAAREFEVWIPYSSTAGLTDKPLPGDTITLKDDPDDSGNDIKSLDRILETDKGGWLCRFI